RLRSSGAAMPADAVNLSRDASAALGLTTGDTIAIVAPRTRLTPFGAVPIMKQYRIAAVLPPAAGERAGEATLDTSEMERLFATNGPTTIEMYGDAADADAIQQKLAADFPGVQVKTWKEINRPLFLALRLEKVVMFVTISLIIFVAALNIISSLS